MEWATREALRMIFAMQGSLPAISWRVRVRAPPRDVGPGRAADGAGCCGVGSGGVFSRRAGAGWMIGEAWGATDNPPWRLAKNWRPRRASCTGQRARRAAGTDVSRSSSRVSKISSSGWPTELIAPARREQTDRYLVCSDDRAVRSECQGAIVQQVDELRPCMKSHDAGIVMVLEEDAFLDELRRHVDECHRVRLAGAGSAGIYSGGVENGEERSAGSWIGAPEHDSPM